jgi:hypothetical protein
LRDNPPAIRHWLRNHAWSTASCGLAGSSILILFAAQAIQAEFSTYVLSSIALLASPIFVFAGLITAIVGVARHEGAFAVVGLVASSLLIALMLVVVAVIQGGLGMPLGLLTCS